VSYLEVWNWHYWWSWLHYTAGFQHR
jgi:hypothetical protein